MYGFIDSPPFPNDIVKGNIQIWGWVNPIEEQISNIEIWIDGKKRGNAIHGISRPTTNGNYGFNWNWNTELDSEGRHVIEVKVVSKNNSEILLPSAINRNLYLSVYLKHSEVDQQTLRLQLAEILDMSEIKILCFDLGIEYENIKDTDKNSTIINLILFFRKKSNFNELFDYIKKIRPKFTPPIG